MTHIERQTNKTGAGYLAVGMTACPGDEMVGQEARRKSPGGRPVLAALSDLALSLAAEHTMSAGGHRDLQLRPQRGKTGGKTLLFRSI